jgi:choline dehydrogenase
LENDGVIAEQLSPKADEDLHAFVKNNAWGHHASCTCKICPDKDTDAVLDKDFQVRGAKNLRVVDASVFPRIPGLFILSAVYMISEKASDVIIDKYRQALQSGG